MQNHPESVIISLSFPYTLGAKGIRKEGTQPLIKVDFKHAKVLSSKAIVLARTAKRGVIVS